MKSYKWPIVLLLAIFIVVAFELLVYFRVSRNVDRKDDSNILNNQEKVSTSFYSENVSPSSVKELVGKTESVKEEHSRNSDGSIGNSVYITIKGNIYSIDRENRIVLISISFAHGWFIKSRIVEESPWIVDNEKYERDYFLSLKRGDYIFASCVDDDCNELSGLKVNVYKE